MTFFFNSWNASDRPTVTVDLPSPAGVGLIAVTNTTLPLLSLGFIWLISILAL